MTPPNADRLINFIEATLRTARTEMRCLYSQAKGEACPNEPWEISGAVGVALGAINDSLKQLPELRQHFPLAPQGEPSEPAPPAAEQERPTEPGVWFRDEEVWLVRTRDFRLYAHKLAFDEDASHSLGTTIYVPDLARWRWHRAIPSARVAELEGENERLKAMLIENEHALAYAPENAWHQLTKDGIEFYEIDGDGEPYGDKRKIVWCEDKGDSSVGIDPSRWWQAVMPKAGERDHFVMCGRFAIKALELGYDENSPREVEDAIHKLRDDLEAAGSSIASLEAELSALKQGETK